MAVWNNFGRNSRDPGTKFCLRPKFFQRGLTSCCPTVKINRHGRDARRWRAALVGIAVVGIAVSASPSSDANEEPAGLAGRDPNYEDSDGDDSDSDSGEDEDEDEDVPASHRRASAHHIKLPPRPPSHQDSLRRFPPLLPSCPLPSSPKRELMARLDSLLLLLCMQVSETRTTRRTTRTTTRTTARTRTTRRTTMSTGDDDDGDLRPDGDRRLLRCRGPSRRDGGAATTTRRRRTTRMMEWRW